MHRSRATWRLESRVYVPFTAEAGVRHPIKRQLHATNVGRELLAVNHTAVLPRHAPGGGSALIADRCVGFRLLRFQ